MGVPYEFDAERFSRWMAYALRHNPTRYGLSPDRNGYVDLELFCLTATQRYPGMTEERLRSLIDAGGSGRFELIGNRLRARYGHSIAVEPPGPTVVPPAWLYYGTEAGHAQMMLAQGLEPADRHFVHLSETADDALAIARHKTDRPAIIRINAQEASQAGVVFYREHRVYLAARIGPQFLSLEPVAA